MIDGDITRNIADSRQLMQKQEMIESHEAGCECECCCGVSESNCQDNLAQCAEAQQPSERRKKMKGKLVPVLVNSALLLAVVGLSNMIANAHVIRSAAAINITPADEIRIGNISLDGVAVVINEVNPVDEIGNSTATVIADPVIENADIDPIDPIDTAIGAAQINAPDLIEPIAGSLDIARVLTAIVPYVESVHAITSVNRDVFREIPS